VVIVKQKNADMSNPTFEFEVFSGKLQTYELIGLIELIACRVQSPELKQSGKHVNHTETETGDLSSSSSSSRLDKQNAVN